MSVSRRAQQESLRGVPWWSRPQTLLFEMFLHLPGFALQMALGFLTHLLNQTTEGPGSISELLPETGWMDSCGGPEPCSQFA